MKAQEIATYIGIGSFFLYLGVTALQDFLAPIVSGIFGG